MSPARPDSPDGGRPEGRGGDGASRNRRRRPRRGGSPRGEGSEPREGAPAAGAKSPASDAGSAGSAGGGQRRNGERQRQGEGARGDANRTGQERRGRRPGQSRDAEPPKGGGDDRGRRQAPAKQVETVDAASESARGRGSRRRSGRGAKAGAQPEAADERFPELASWAFAERGFTVWTARMKVQPPTSDGRAWRTYIVDVHLDELAVDRRFLAELAPLLELSVLHAREDAGVAELAARFAAAAIEADLPDANAYRERLPEEALVPGQTPTQNALGTLLPLDLDTDQETIDLLNEGRRGAPRGGAA